MFRSLDSFASTASVFHRASLCPPLELHWLHCMFLIHQKEPAQQIENQTGYTIPVVFKPVLQALPYPTRLIQLIRSLVETARPDLGV